METLRAQEASSSSTSRCSYDVFLSFRGPDTRKTFTDHLYSALVQAGFRTFRDDEELEPGKHVKSGLNGAIQQSRLSLIVLSKSYASSKWCLDELLEILECKKSSGHQVVPVFYHVEPSEVRYQTGSIKEAFDRHEEKFNEERVNKWRAALKEVADLSGKVLQIQSDRYESTFIKDIIEVVNAQVDRPALKIPRFPVGLYSRAKSINLWLNDGSADVDVLVIWGMVGGLGKTTIAKYVYNSNHHKFERSCFLEDINRESCNQSNGLLKLQRQLHSRILRGQKGKIYNVDEGTPKIEDAIRCNRVFIVLDDVDNVKQLDTLIGTRDFYPGSKIIITTRNKGFLIKARKIRKLRDVEMEMLDNDESLKLFSWHAFGQDHPLEGYTDQSIRVAQRCVGVPLALEVLGSSLAGKGINEWNSALQKLVAIEPIQGLHEFGIFSTWIPVTEVPSWFSDENRRLSPSFTVPSPPNNSRIRGLNVCAVYGCANRTEIIDTAYTKIHNETKNLTWIYHPIYFGLPNGNEDLAWLSNWKFGNQLEGGDVITVTVVMLDQFPVKEIGVNLVYGEMEDNVPENIDDKENDEVIGGDLTNYELSTGVYFLSHHGSQADPDLIRRVIGDNFTIEELDTQIKSLSWWTETGWARLLGDNIKTEVDWDWT